MKHRLFSRSIALFLVFGLLLTGSILPVSATAISEVVDSSNNLILDGDLIEDDNLIIPDEIILCADDSSIAEESMILKYVDSAQFNAARHTKRLTDLEDLNTYVFANADGTRSVYMMHENVKYIDKNGVIKEKDISLINKAGGFGITLSNIELLIPTNPVNGIDFEYSGFAIKLTPQGLATDLSAVQSDNSIIYDEAYGENTKLVYTPMLSGLKEDIVLTEYTDDATYTFVLETDGLKLYNGENGYYLADSVKTEPVFYLGEIIIYDAVGKPDIGNMTVETISEGQEYLLTVIANEEFLANPTTVYPVTVDPSITVSDNDTSGSIIDSPIFEGYPDWNFGAYLFNRVGTPSEAYGIGRTVVKLSGLTNSNEYQTITANQITNATFYAKEASGGIAHYINIYPLTSNTTWTETTVTWNNIGSYTTSINFGNTMYNGQWTAFDITTLVKAWKNGTYSANAGFIMTNENEANDKCFCSSEYSNSSSRPYVVMTYDTAISLNYTSASIAEGGTRTLVATTKPSGQTVTWTTSNGSIATVSSSGVVTAKKAGTVTITAGMIDADGITRTATCTIYVYIANGVYYIKNLNSNYYLHVKYGGITNLNDVYQCLKYSDSTSNNYKIRQMWKTYYLGNGRYSIRSMHKLDIGLDVTGCNVDIFNIGTSDTLSSVPSYGEWTISWYSTGYVFKNNGSNSKTMQIENASTSSGATVVASTYSTSVNCRWGLTKISSPPSGAYWFDTNTESVVSGNPTDSKYIIYGSKYDIDDLGLVAIAYSLTSNYQTFTWSSSNTAIATINSSTGAIVGKTSGETKITAKRYINGSYQTLSFDLIVIGADQYSAGVRIAKVNGKQYYDFTIPVNELFENAVALCEDHRCMNWTQYCTWAYDVSIFYQPSISEHKGMQLGSFLWFYHQVNHGAVWDIKRETQWKAALPDLPYLRDEDGKFGDFVFRGAVTTAEGLGNIMYGYAGRATGFGEVTLYWGGGVAAQGSVNSDAVTQPPYYGDSKEDHDNIKLGFDMFNEDYPNYPDVGYDGIPLDGWLAAIADVILNSGT